MWAEATTPWSKSVSLLPTSRYYSVNISSCGSLIREFVFDQLWDKCQQQCVSFQVVDFVKAVNCTYTLGVFTKWDLFRGNSFSDEYGDITTDDVKARCIEEFMNAVSDRGRVYFVDSQTHKDASSHTSHQVTHSTCFYFDKKETSLYYSCNNWYN